MGHAARDVALEAPCRVAVRVKAGLVFLGAALLCKERNRTKKWRNERKKPLQRTHRAHRKPSTIRRVEPTKHIYHALWLSSQYASLLLPSAAAEQLIFAGLPRNQPLERLCRAQSVNNWSHTGCIRQFAADRAGKNLTLRLTAVRMSGCLWNPGPTSTSR